MTRVGLIMARSVSPEAVKAVIERRQIREGVEIVIGGYEAQERYEGGKLVERTGYAVDVLIARWLRERGARVVEGFKPLPWWYVRWDGYNGRPLMPRPLGVAGAVVAHVATGGRGSSVALFSGRQGDPRISEARDFTRWLADVPVRVSRGLWPAPELREVAL